MLTLVCEWREADSAERYRGGRKPTIDDEVILTLMLVLVAERSALKGTILGHALGHRLTNAAKEALGISHLFDGTTRNWNQLARRAIRRLTKTWDAWGGGRKCAIGRLEREKLEEDLAENEDFVEDPESEVERVVLEPQAGLYPVEKGAAVKDSAGVTTWVASDWQMAFMGNVMLGVYEDPSADNTLAPPQLAFAGSLSAPNKRIGEHTIALVDIIMGRGTKISRLSFDKGYTQLTVEKFHRPLRERGIKVVKDYKGGKVGGQKGITNGFGGAHFVEGDWYCASTPKELLEATIRYDDGLITVEEYWRDIDLRQAYKLHIKDHNPNPSSVKYQCPAMGDSATVDCPLRTMTKKALQKDNLAPINESQILERDVDICCKKSLNIPIAESEKESGQKYGYATRAHNRVYKADRASSESANDFLHNDASVLSDPTNRPMRGLAVAQLAWALMLVAFNMTRIAQYMHERFKLEQKNLALKLRTGISVPMPKPGARRRPPKRLRDRNDRSHYRRGYKARPTVVVSRT